MTYTARCPECLLRWGHRQDCGRRVVEADALRQALIEQDERREQAARRTTEKEKETA